MSDVNWPYEDVNDEVVEEKAQDADEFPVPSIPSEYNSYQEDQQSGFHSGNFYIIFSCYNTRFPYYQQTL